MQKPFNVEVGARRRMTGTYDLLGEGYDDRTIHIHPSADEAHIEVPVDAGLIVTDDLAEFFVASALRNYTGAAENAVEVPAGTIAVRGPAETVELHGRAPIEQPGYLVQAINHLTARIEELEQEAAGRRWFGRIGILVGALGLTWGVGGDQISAWVKATLGGI